MNKIILDGQPITPSKILCVGRNYVEHIHELGNEMPDSMVLFIKPNSAISDTLYAMKDEPLHYEGELCFLYRGGRFAAVGFGLDLTKRTLQAQLKAKGLPWERAKAFDGSAVFSPFVTLEDQTDLSFTLAINEEPRQQGDPGLMIYKPAEILAELQTFVTLEEGDIIMTGTPQGVGQVNAGDRFAAMVFAGAEPIISAAWTAE